MPDNVQKLVRYYPHAKCQPNASIF